MFQTPLILESAAADLWVVRQPLIWVDDKYGSLTAPVGFMTDLASIPRILRNLPAFDPNGVSRRPAVVHDWLYWSQGAVTKRTADWFLHDAMISEGASA